MRQSAERSREWERELEIISDQYHVDKVWSVMVPRVDQYADRYFADRMHEGGPIRPEQAAALHINRLAMDNEGLHDTYHNLFDPDDMEEYGEDTEGFKSVALKKKCPVIANTLSSRVDDLKEWKTKFYGCKSQRLYDAFLNMTEFAAHYDATMDEAAMGSLDKVADCRLSEMEDDKSEYGSCYVSGVVGYGIVANILNHMYPRTFPGSHKAGTWSLFFLSWGDDSIAMPSGTSEFTMLQDAHGARHGGNCSIEHNYFLRYEVFCIYTLRIYRHLAERIRSRYGLEYPCRSRFLLTNDFYEFVRNENWASISTMTGSDLLSEV